MSSIFRFCISSSLSELLPSVLNLMLAVAGHVVSRCSGVSSSPPHLPQMGDVASPILNRCLLSLQCPVNAPTIVCRWFLDLFRRILAVLSFGSVIMVLLCLQLFKLFHSFLCWAR